MSHEPYGKNLGEIFGEYRKTKDTIKFLSRRTPAKGRAMGVFCCPVHAALVLL